MVGVQRCCILHLEQVSLLLLLLLLLLWVERPVCNTDCSLVLSNAVQCVAPSA
jgi:hypothetical protein